MVLYDGTTDAPTLTLQVDPSVLGEFTLDLSTLNGTAVLGSTPAWTTLPISTVRGIAIRRGRSLEDQPNDAVTMVVEFDNTTGNYDPNKTTSPYTSTGASWWKAGLPVRLYATWQGVDYRLFTGRLQDPVTDLQPFLPLASFTFVDGIAAASSDLTGYTPAVETTASRANRVLDLMGWPTSDRTILGTKTLLASGETSSATAVLEECAKAEAGRFYVDAMGYMRLTNRADALTRSTELVLADDGTASSINYLSLKTSPGVRTIVNQATATNGTYSVTITNNTSIGQTRVKSPVNVNVPLSSSADLDTLATYLANYRATPSTRVESVEVQCIGIGTAWPGLLGLDLGDRLQVKRNSSNGVGVDVVVTAEGIDHTIRPGSWIAAFTTAPVDVTLSGFTLGTSLLNSSTDLLAA